MNDSYPKLETKRLILRPFFAKDIDVYAKWMANKTIMKSIGDGTTRNYKEAWNNLAWICGHWTLRGYGPWAVEEKTSQRLIGRAGLFNPEGWPGVELIWLLDPDFWGKGFATEAAKASMDYAFKQLELKQLISLIRPDNLPSIRVAERLGMKFVEELTHHKMRLKKYSTE